MKGEVIPLIKPRWQQRFFRINLSLFLLLLFVMLASLFWSVSGFQVSDLWRATSKHDQAVDIFLVARFPRVLLGALAGMALASAGVAFQALLRNPLADPYVLGVTGGASLGGILGLTFFGGLFPILGIHLVTLSSFLGAIVTMFLIYAIAREASGRLSIYSLLLAGVVFTSFTTALIMFINSLADFQQAHEILHWLMGNVGSKSYASIGWFAFYVALSFAILFSQSARYNALSLGEEAAEHLGVPVERTKRLTFFAASILVGTVVASCGMIGFVGLIVPHMVRLMIGSDHRLLLPAATLFGGSFLVATDFLARTLLYPTELPVGVITALLGGPFFVYLLLRQRSPVMG